MSISREVIKIRKQIDKISKVGKDNYLEFYNLLDDYIKKSKWDLVKQTLFIEYGVDLHDMSVSDAKPFSWKEVLKQTNKPLAEKKNTLFKSKGVWTQSLIFYRESDNSKLGTITELISPISEEYQFLSNRIFDRYTVSTQRKYLEYSKLELILNPSQVTPFFIPNILNNNWEPEWLGTFSTSNDHSSYPLFFDSEDFVLRPESKTRISSGLRHIGLSQSYIDQVTRYPEDSIDLVLDGNKYISQIDQRINISFDLTLIPTGGTGSISASIYNFKTGAPIFVDLIIGGVQYHKYIYDDGEQIIMSGSRYIDLKKGDEIGLGLYNESISLVSSIIFTISDASVEYQTLDVKNAPAFLIKSDIDWIRLINSFKMTLIGDIGTEIPKVSLREIIISTWDDSLSYEKNVINLYSESIDYLIDNYDSLTT
jgi:hypothetical protein